jgi:integrase
VTELGRDLAPASVAKCFGTRSMILAAAVRGRLIPFNPCEGVQLPSTHRPRRPARAITRSEFFEHLLPVVPVEHRALVALAAGAGLRWGECAGLAWSGVDLVAGTARVVQVVVESGGRRTIKRSPKSKAGIRTVPLPAFLVALLHGRRRAAGADESPTGLIFVGRDGQPLLRASFRRDVWRPSLVRAGLLGSVVQLGPDKWRAGWTDRRRHRMDQGVPDRA